MKNKIDKNRISLAGEFAVLSKLSFLGFEASLTLGNTKGVDILVLNPKTEKMFRVEVKTSFKEGNYVKKSKDFGEHIQWLLSKSAEENNSKDLFYCFVILDEKGNQRFFIIPSNVVAEYLFKQHRFWLSGNNSRKDTSMRSFYLSTNKSFKSVIKTPLVEDFEDRWDLLK